MSAAWHDKPTEPGLWIRIAEGGIGEGSLNYVHDVNDKHWKDDSRWYGPIPPDNGVRECL